MQDLVRDKLKSLGFEFVRFTRPPLDEGALYFLEYLKKSYHGQMAYLANNKEKILDPSKLLKDVQSVIVVAYFYDVGVGTNDFFRRRKGFRRRKKNEATSSLKAHISRYALGDDYHDIIGKKLISFKYWLKEVEPQSRCYLSVDAAPVLEKAWAKKAGLGWMGKHSNMIHPQRGSYFFLSAIFTNLSFVSDAPMEDRCGNCDRCIQACPTGAIVAPYVVDARRCISYLTVELKGPIPRDLRPLMGSHIFGCDDCQDACPWNRFSQTTLENRFLPHSGLDYAHFEEFLSLDEDSFRHQFASSPILRTKRRGFLRNVLVAIGNSQEKSLAASVKKMFQDPDALVREHAVWAYHRLLGEKEGCVDDPMEKPLQTYL